jgi:hypothetical protein
MENTCNEQISTKNRLFITKNPMSLRRIIREQIEALVEPQVIEKEFDKDIIYLDGFKFVEKKQKDGYSVWVFEIKRKDYILKFYIQKNESTERWAAKLFIYWKKLTGDFTSAEGKDFEEHFGPFKTYEELVFELNRKLKNNPLISPQNYIDDNKSLFNKEIVNIIEKVKDSKEKIRSVKDKKFNDLKEILKTIESIKDTDELIKKINQLAPEEEDKQTLLMDLQKIYQLDFYLNKENMDSLFKHIYNKRNKNKKK